MTRKKMKFAMTFLQSKLNKAALSKSQMRAMLTCFFDLNSAATLAASHKDQESNGSIVEVCWM